MTPYDWFTWFKQPQYQNFALDANGEAFGFVFQVPKTGSIRKVGFRTGTTVTASDTLRLGLYTVLTTSGVPTSSLYGGSATGTVSGLVANTTYTVTLGTDASAVVGDIIALVIEFEAYVSGNLNLAGMGSAGTAQQGVFPYTVFRANTTSSIWTKQTPSPVFWVEYSDGSYAYIPVSSPYSAITTVAVDVNASPADEYALTFSLNFPARLSGIGTFITTNDGPFNVKFYDVTAGSTATFMYVSSATFNPSTSNGYMTVLQSSNPVNLGADKTYRISLQPTTTTTKTIYYATFPNLLSMNQTPGGVDFYMSTTTNSGAWSDSPTRRPFISLILDKFNTVP